MRYFEAQELPRQVQSLDSQGNTITTRQAGDNNSTIVKPFSFEELFARIRPLVIVHETNLSFWLLLPV